jgi:hypothetical protein
LALLLSDVQVIDRIMNDVLPVIRQSGLAGHAEYVTRSIFFTENPIAIDMLVDILTDRYWGLAAACRPRCTLVCIDAPALAYYESLGAFFFIKWCF